MGSRQTDGRRPIDIDINSMLFSIDLNFFDGYLRRRRYARRSLERQGEGEGKEDGKRTMDLRPKSEK